MQQFLQFIILTFIYNMFRASSRPSLGAQELQLQPLVYLRSVVIAVLLVVVGPAGPTTTNSTIIATIQR